MAFLTMFWIAALSRATVRRHTGRLAAVLGVLLRVAGCGRRRYHEATRADGYTRRHIDDYSHRHFGFGNAGFHTNAGGELSV